MIFTVLVSALNQFFSMRYPSVAITAMVAQLLALPAGRACERILPAREYTVTLPAVPLNGGPWTKQRRFSLNPGPFNVKEHCLITVMANVVAGGAYATDIIAAQRIFYLQQWSTAYQLLLVISTQMLGFSLAGVCRRFLVWPSSMIWPATLVNAALFSTQVSITPEKPASLPPMVMLTSVVAALSADTWLLTTSEVVAPAQATETNEAGELAAAHCSG